MRLYVILWALRLVDLTVSARACVCGGGVWVGVGGCRCLWVGGWIIVCVIFPPNGTPIWRVVDSHNQHSCCAMKSPGGTRYHHHGSRDITHKPLSALYCTIYGFLLADSII